LLLKNLRNSTEDELKAEIVQCKRENAANMEKVKRLKHVMASQDEAIKNHLQIEESFKAEKESHEERVRRLKVIQIVVLASNRVYSFCMM
jgi:hypothetical protein